MLLTCNAKSYQLLKVCVEVHYVLILKKERVASSGTPMTLTLKLQGQTEGFCFRPITLLFMVEFRYCLVQLIVITRRRVAHKIPIATFSAKGSKFISGP